MSKPCLTNWFSSVMLLSVSFLSSLSFMFWPNISRAMVIRNVSCLHQRDSCTTLPRPEWWWQPVQGEEDCADSGQTREAQGFLLISRFNPVSRFFFEWSGLEFHYKMGTVAFLLSVRESDKLQQVFKCLWRLSEEQQNSLQDQCSWLEVQG